MSVQGWATAWVIPEELRNLTFLTNLVVSRNNIQGSLPSFIGNFKHLSYLDISDNNFNGSLPHEIGTLPSLEYLDISSAGFKGLLPPELGNLSRLQQLYIRGNGFNGLLPPELGNLSSLQVLYLGYNGFNGLLPPELGNLSSLQKLVVSNNSITGPFPAFIGNITSMLYLDLSRNYITGNLPASISNLMNLSTLDVSKNYITGPLPASIGNLTNLTKLDVSMNALSGSIPKELGNLRNLSTLYINSNNFTGSLPPELGNLTSLETLSIDSCGLSGKIPSTFAHLRNVKSLSMQGNAFEGPIPFSFSKLTLLIYLMISDVSNGSSSLNFIENMTSLRILVLRNNMIFGTIPSTIGKHQSLEHIDLSYNQLSGSFPSWVLGGVPNLNLVFNNLVFNSSMSRDLSLNCLQRRSSCYQNSQYHTSFAIRCGGPSMTINDTEYEGDKEPLGPVSYKVASTEKWAVSNVGVFTDYQSSNTTYSREIKDVPNTTDAWLVKYARISPGSLRYYGLGLENGNYTVNLKFAETEFPDSKTGKSVGKRVFDIYLQGNLAWKDFDIKKEAGIAFKGIEKKQWVMVHEHILEIHLLWAGKGTCCIPSRGTYGPAISAILVTPNFETDFKLTVRTQRKKNKTALAAKILAPVVLSIVSLSLYF